MKRRSCLPLFFAFAILVYTTSCQHATPLPTATLTPVPTSAVAPTPTPTLVPTSTAIPKLEAGNYKRDMVVDNLYRYYIIHIPPSLDNLKPVPVVFVFHEWQEQPTDIQTASGFDGLADKNGFLVVYPWGTSFSWNAGGCCGFAVEKNRDEIAFIGQILSDLTTITNPDPKRIYATGFSNGAMLAYRLACEMSATFAAIAPVGGVLFYSPCQPQQPVSVMHIHGQLWDKVIPYTGGQGTGLMEGLIFPPVEEGIATWVKENGCTGSPQEEKQESLTHTVYAYCQAGSAVEIYLINNMRHAWPRPFIFQTSKIWDFFVAHPKP